MQLGDLVRNKLGGFLAVSSPPSPPLPSGAGAGAGFGTTTPPPPPPPPLEPALPSHPYYPPDAAIPHYAPSSTPVWVLIASLAGMLAGVLGLASLVARRLHRGPLAKASLAVYCWFVLCGSLHCFFEGYFIFNHATIASSQNLFAQLWREYALSDSRYLTSDPFMLSVESITVFFWGPLCFLCAAAIVAQHPLRHLLQSVMCAAHLQSVALYYATSLTEMYLTGRTHSRPEFLYFWVYYVGFNLPWVVVPAVLLYGSMTTLQRQLRSLDVVSTGLASFQARTPLERGVPAKATLDESKKAR